ncbi:MAG: tetratricopeptide repeat protein [Nitrospirota bacterium]|jgi:tetratricopeptide (TPR) repeat protein
MDNIEKLKEKVDKDPSSALFVPLAEEYRKAGDLEGAIETLRAGIERQPGYMSARVALAKIYLQQNMLKEAREELEHVVAAVPDNIFACKKLLDIYRELGDLPRAVEQARKVLELNPGDEETCQFLEGVKAEELGEGTPPGEEAVFESLGEEEEEYLGAEEPLGMGAPAGEAEEEAELGDEEFILSLSEKAEEEEGEGLREREAFELEFPEPEEGAGPPEEEAPGMGEEMAPPEEEVPGMEEEMSPPEVQVQETVSLEELEKEFQDMKGPAVEEEPPPHEAPAGPPSEADVLLGRADEAVRTEDYGKAMDLYGELLSGEPDNPRARERLQELKWLLKMTGKEDEVLEERLSGFLDGIKKRRDEFLGNT